MDGSANGLPNFPHGSERRHVCVRRGGLQGGGDRTHAALTSDKAARFPFPNRDRHRLRSLSAQNATEQKGHVLYSPFSGGEGGPLREPRGNTEQPAEGRLEGEPSGSGLRKPPSPRRSPCPRSLEARRPLNASPGQGSTSQRRPRPGIFQGSRAIKGHILFHLQQAASRAIPEGLG